MHDRIVMTLLIGPAVPLPAPKFVQDALTSVTVTNTAESNKPSAFQLQFMVSNKSPLQTLFLLSGGFAPPIFRVVIVVTVEGRPQVLVDGVMTKQDIQPGSDTGHSILTVSGVDHTAIMGMIDFSGLPYMAMPPHVQVLIILAKYAFLGVVPLVIPSILTEVQNPIDRFDSHWGTDIQYVRKLAKETGYVFYITPGPVPGTSTAYWGPEVRVGVPQPALNVDMDALTNVEQLSFTFDAERKSQPLVFIQEKTTKLPIPIPIPDITPLKPPLGLIAPLTKKIRPVAGTGHLSGVRAALLGLARAAQSADSVKGTGTLDVVRYGRVLRARELVGVRGVGMAFDGAYYVQSVTHNLKLGEYKQSFTLTRNGLVSTLPRVPV
jgi:hypothetical protein